MKRMFYSYAPGTTILKHTMIVNPNFTSYRNQNTNELEKDVRGSEVIVFENGIFEADNEDDIAFCEKLVAGQKFKIEGTNRYYEPPRLIATFAKERIEAPQAKPETVVKEVQKLVVFRTSLDSMTADQMKEVLAQSGYEFEAKTYKKEDLVEALELNGNII